MGCDWHPYIEVFNREHGVWEAIKGKDKYDGKDTYRWFGTGRNYLLFSLLADVRNSYGIDPIDYPRGLPLNKSLIVELESKKWEGDGHSHSWYLLNELLEYDFDISYEESGYVNEEDYLSYKKDKLKRPSNWCGDIFGCKIEKIGESDYKNLVREKDKKYYISCKWSYSLYDDCDYFVRELKKLKKLSDNPSDIRLVFWFDN